MKGGRSHGLLYVLQAGSGHVPAERYAEQGDLAAVGSQRVM